MALAKAWPAHWSRCAIAPTLGRRERSGRPQARAAAKISPAIPTRIRGGSLTVAAQARPLSRRGQNWHGEAVRRLRATPLERLMSDAIAPRSPRRSNAVLAAFSAVCLPLAAFGVALPVTLPEFYATHVGLELGVVAAVFMVVRLIDITFDPFIGWAMDRTKTKFGRYRPWMALVDADPDAVGLHDVRGGPAGRGAGLSVRLAAGPLSRLLDRDAGTAGLGLGAGARVRPAQPGLWLVAGVQHHRGDPDPDPADGRDPDGHRRLCRRRADHGLGHPDRPARHHGPGLRRRARAGQRRAPRRTGGWGPIWSCSSAKAVRKLLLADVVLGVAPGITGSLLFFFFGQIKGYDHTQASLFMLLYFVAGLVGAPFWAWLATRIGKDRALAVASLVFAVFYIGATLVPGGSFAADGRGHVHRRPALCGGSVPAPGHDGGRGRRGAAGDRRGPDGADVLHPVGDHQDRARRGPDPLSDPAVGRLPGRAAAGGATPTTR